MTRPAVKPPPLKPPIVRVLRLIGLLIPGTRLKTFIYLNIIARPRKLLRGFLDAFYRMDHVYEIQREFTRTYRGNFSILEFGTADGYAFTKILYSTKYLNLTDRITVHGFDSFEGMPDSDDGRDQDIVDGDGWREGQYKGRYQQLIDYCSKHYTNFEIHKGYFEETLTDEFLDKLADTPPILVWVDCDFYTSAKTVLEKLLDRLPNGCVVYFDDIDFNFGSRLTGEARLIHEINSGVFGDDMELVLDPSLSIHSRRLYRFFRLDSEIKFSRWHEKNVASRVHKRTDDSPFP